MPDPPGFDDESVKNLGRGVAAHFAGLYPLASLDLIDRLRGLIEHYGSGRRAAAAVGVSASTLRRWARGTTPNPDSRRKADRAYLGIHLDLHHFNPANTFEARMASAFSAGAGITALGRLAEHIMTKENNVPTTATFPKVVGFTPGMSQMWAPECTVSDGDNREQFPFNTGSY